jgi:hypothetical protein
MSGDSAKLSVPRNTRARTSHDAIKPLEERPGREVVTQTCQDSDQSMTRTYFLFSFIDQRWT